MSQGLVTGHREPCGLTSRNVFSPCGGCRGGRTPGVAGPGPLEALGRACPCFFQLPVLIVLGILVLQPPQPSLCFHLPCVRVSIKSSSYSNAVIGCRPPGARCGLTLTWSRARRPRLRLRSDPQARGGAPLTGPGRGLLAWPSPWLLLSFVFVSLSPPGSGTVLFFLTFFSR